MLLTVAEVAEKLRVDRTTVYRWIKSGKLKAYRAGQQFRIDEEDLMNFLCADAIKKRWEEAEAEYKAGKTIDLRDYSKKKKLKRKSKYYDSKN